MTMFKYVVCFTLLAVSLGNVRGISHESHIEFMKKIQPVFEECSKKLGEDLEALKEAKKNGDLSSINKCFMACVLKEIKVLNDDGKIDLEEARKHYREFITDEEDLKQIDAIGETCISVNEEEVSDGNEGCERAHLLLTCVKKLKKD